MRSFRTAIVVAVGAIVLAHALAPAVRAQEECDNGEFSGTYDLIQQAIFENKGCTSMACHGASAAGGLQLTADVSYENLISQPSTTVGDADIPGLLRVVPGQKDQSLLFLNLAAGTLPDLWEAPIRAMPLGVAPLSLNELEAVREWIEQGAPREGTVPGTGELLDACLPPAKPLEIEPLVPPAPGEGVQLRMPKWILPAESEDEVCFTSYFDLTDQVPQRFLSPNGQSFRYNANQIRQDPLSHHLIVNYYGGVAGPDDSSWGTYRCRGGEKDGEICVPTELGFCGPDAECGSDPDSGAVCIGYGPSDRTESSVQFAGIQEASSQQVFPEGTFREAPLKGIIVWNSHAFNLTDEAGKVEGWLNFNFVEPEEQEWFMRGIFNTSRIFEQRVAPFEAQLLCQHHVLPPNTRLYELNSHTHQRGKRFSIFSGRYECQGGANDGDPCSPLDSGLPVPDLCAGEVCAAAKVAGFGDCDGDARIGVGDLITCVNIAVGARDMADCPNSDEDGSGAVTIDEVVGFVEDGLTSDGYRDAEEDLLYTNLVYNDPTVVIYEPAMRYPDASSSSAARSLTYCSLYDNGMTDPSDVKQRSTSPESSGFLGGPCARPSGCTEGRVGEPCTGGTDEDRDASCDSTPGAGDGFCDACQLRGGFTTEDEMFILMGAFYVETP